MSEEIELARVLTEEGIELADKVGVLDVIRDSLVGPRADTYRYRRAARAALIVDQTAKELQATGVTHYAVEDSTLRAVMEHGTLDDDPGIQSMWASLLANAIASDVPRAYPEILRQIEPPEARMLRSVLADQGGHPHDPSVRPGVGTIASHLELEDPLTWERLGNLERLGLIKYSGPTPATQPDADQAKNTIWIDLSPLGRALIAVCSPAVVG